MIFSVSFNQIINKKQTLKRQVYLLPSEPTNCIFLGLVLVGSIGTEALQPCIDTVLVFDVTPKKKIVCIDTLFVNEVTPKSIIS